MSKATFKMSSSLRCDNCYREYSTAFNLMRHKRKCGLDEDDEGTDSNEDIDSTGGTETGQDDDASDDSAEEGRESWQFLLDLLKEKESDFSICAEKLKADLVRAGVSEDGAEERSDHLYYKLLADELRDHLMNLILDLKVLRNDAIYESIMRDVKDSGQPFKIAFNDAWRKYKNDVIDKVLKPAFPEEEDEESEEDEQDEVNESGAADEQPLQVQNLARLKFHH
jgi:hypothetical protein